MTAALLAVPVALDGAVLPSPVANETGVVRCHQIDPEFERASADLRKTDRHATMPLDGAWQRDDSLAHVGIHASDELTSWERPEYQPGDVLLVEALGPDGQPVPFRERVGYLGILVRMDGTQPVLRYDGPEPWGTRELVLPPVRVRGYVVSVTHAPIMGHLVCAERWGWEALQVWDWCRTARNGEARS